MKKRMSVCVSAALAVFLALTPAAKAADGDFEDAMADYDAEQFDAARGHLERLAERGHSGAETMLGVMYFNGQGVKADPAFAAIWFFKAARKGNPNAQLAFGSLHIRGIGVGQSLVKAHKWLFLAETRSEGEVKGEAARLRTEIEALMTEDEIARARANAQSWRPVVASGSD